MREAVLDLIRIGLDRVAGFVTEQSLRRHGETGGTLVSMRQLDIAEMKQRLHSTNAFLLDVRSAAEFAQGHVEGAYNIAHTRMAVRQGELPKDREIMVICQVGERSGCAASYLERLGFDVAHIRGGFSAWKDAREEVYAGVS